MKKQTLISLLILMQTHLLSYKKTFDNEVKDDVNRLTNKTGNVFATMQEPCHVNLAQPVRRRPSRQDVVNVVVMSRHGRPTSSSAVREDEQQHELVIHD